MANNREKMPISERAKQFAPFAALTGYEDAIAKIDEIVLTKKDHESLQIYEDLLYQGITAEDIIEEDENV